MSDEVHQRGTVDGARVARLHCSKYGECIPGCLEDLAHTGGCPNKVIEYEVLQTWTSIGTEVNPVG